MIEHVDQPPCCQPPLGQSSGASRRRCAIADISVLRDLPERLVANRYLVGRHPTTGAQPTRPVTRLHGRQEHRKVRRRPFEVTFASSAGITQAPQGEAEDGRTVRRQGPSTCTIHQEPCRRHPASGAMPRFFGEEGRDHRRHRPDPEDQQILSRYVTRRRTRPSGRPAVVKMRTRTGSASRALPVSVRRTS